MQKEKKTGKVSFGVYRSPLGNIFAFSKGGKIFQLCVGKEDFLKRLKRKHGDCLREDKNVFSGFFRLLGLYFAGKAVSFDVSLPLEGTSFEKRVWKMLQTIPYGEVRSYKWVAEMIKCPKGARAIGNACGKNPLPIVVPCHRVTGSSGRLGGYSLGIGIKKALLEIEGFKESSRARR